jgi:hypothetical protein
MFRFRKPAEPPTPPRPWHAQAAGACGFAARNALLGAAAAARASAAALKWAADRKPAPPAPPRVEPIPVVIVSPPPPVLAARRPAPAREGKSSSKVLPILAVALVVGVLVSASGVKTSTREVAAPPAPQNLARLSPARLSEYTADSGVLGGARAALAHLEGKAKDKLAAVPAPPPPPERPAFQFAADRPAKSTAVKLTGVKSGEPHPTKELALADALIVAQGQLADKLAKLDPPIDHAPGVGRIHTDFLRPDSVQVVRPPADVAAAWREKGLNPNLMWVTVDVEVSDDQVRQLRGDHRLTEHGPLFALPLVLAAGLWGFLRLDAWTRGHFTLPILAGVSLPLLGLIAVQAARRLW